MLKVRLSSLLILSCVAATMADSVMAGQPWAWASGYPKWVKRALNDTVTNVSLHAKARYQGTPPSSDVGRSWHISSEVDVSLGAPGGQPFGQPASGIIQNVMNQIVECGNSCAASFDFDNCDSNDEGTRIDGAAEVIVAADTNKHLRTTRSTSLDCDTGQDVEDIDPPISPIIIDLDRNGFHLTGPDDSVIFDMDADGALDQLTWTKAGELDAFLALDLNRNGAIDNGSELFGNHTWLLGGKKAFHGYIGLAQHDDSRSGGNEDGIIDSSDIVFADLRLWIDEDHDGIADEVELFTLEEMGIIRLELDYREDSSRDRYGNSFRYTSRAWRAHKNTEIPVRTTDVFFVSLD